MDKDNVYTPPQASLGAEEKVSTKPSILNIILVVAMTVPMMALQFLMQYVTGGVSAGIGGAIGATIPAFIVVGIFQLGKRFRNSRSRWKIYGWAQLFFFIGQLSTCSRLAALSAAS